MLNRLKKNRALFLDRDGVINKEKGHYISKASEFELNYSIIDELKTAINKGYLLIVVSNQGGIGRDLYSESDVEKLHSKMRKELSGYGVELTEIYYCKHHPSKSKCLCRKPESLMIEKAIARFDIDPLLSFLIGDSKRDIEAANKAGVKGLLINPNEPEGFMNNLEKASLI